MWKDQTLKNMIESWGALYALLSRHIPLTKAQLDHCAFLPFENIEMFHAQAEPFFSRKDNQLFARLRRKCILDLRIPFDQQSRFWSSFEANNGICKKERAVKMGRPPCGMAIDWTNVDWSLGNADIAKQKNCTPESVRKRRRKNTLELQKQNYAGTENIAKNDDKDHKKGDCKRLFLSDMTDEQRKEWFQSITEVLNGYNCNLIESVIQSISRDPQKKD